MLPRNAPAWLDRLSTWLTVSAEEWSAEPTLQDFLTRLGEVADPRQYIRIFDRLLDLSTDEIEALLKSVHPQGV